LIIQRAKFLQLSDKGGIAKFLQLSDKGGIIVYGARYKVLSENILYEKHNTPKNWMRDSAVFFYCAFFRIVRK
jgi:hypothetical protein